MTKRKQSSNAGGAAKSGDTGVATSHAALSASVSDTTVVTSGVSIVSQQAGSAAAAALDPADAAEGTASAAGGVPDAAAGNDTGAAAVAPAAAEGTVSAASVGVSAVEPSADTSRTRPPVRAPIDAIFDHDAAASLIVEVTGPRRGRRRAGRSFGAEPVRVSLADLGEEGLRAIDADPELSWAIVGEAGTEPEA
ncbi:hypothetical protein DFR49_2285 [Hephaestia caeni]|uniref:Mu-like prophage FluMu N-terminal domain-containing protein n=1 Tax=Hephaestia caeni TaxID=645617 RepID=A0A397P7L4_9SPHN|nr:hypothetical protein [Hephaestia caeni]RIA44049.1 hypothetical protein DFR49_2285 [Hephaestia caeni]